MTTPEGRVEAYLVNRVKATGGKIRKLKWIGSNGAPDRLVWWPGAPPAVVFVELKAPGKKATAQQSEEHEKLRADGFSVHVIDSKELVDKFIWLFANEHEVG